MRLPSCRPWAYTADVVQPIRVALVEDLHVTREGLSLLIGGSPGFEMCGQYDSMEQALDQIRSEERRVGKEGRYRWSPAHLKKKKSTMAESEPISYESTQTSHHSMVPPEP